MGLELFPPVKMDLAFNLGPKETTATKVLPVVPYLAFVFFAFLLLYAFKEPIKEGVAVTAKLNNESEGAVSGAFLWNRFILPHGINQEPQSLFRSLITLSKKANCILDGILSKLILEPFANG